MGEALSHLIALHRADKLNKAYENQLKLIISSVKTLRDEITGLVEQNRRLENLLKKNGSDFDSEMHIDQNNYLVHVTANIKESLALLEMYKDRDHLDILGSILGVSNRL